MSTNSAFTSETRKIRISKIRLDGGTQPRVEISQETIEEYADDMRNGDQFRPIIVYFDGEAYWLADGFHRVLAATRCHREVIEAEVRQGTVRDAILHSVGANKDHGLRRSSADKRASVLRLLGDEEWSRWSDRAIAQRVGVSHPFVAKLREQLTGNITSQTKRIGLDGRVIETAHIGENRGQRDVRPGSDSESTLPAQATVSWLHAWESHKHAHPDLVLFPRVGRSNMLWIALDEDAERVGRILGVAPRQFPYANGWKTALKLWVPDPGPAWFQGLYQALEGNVLAYCETDPELKHIADTLIPTAMVAERGRVADQTAADALVTSAHPETNGAPAYIASSSDNGGSHEWYTPPEIVAAVKRALGGSIGLDPASCPEAQAVVRAERYFTKQDDGLSQAWETATLYLNPPYGGEVSQWIEKLLDEHEAGRFMAGLALLPHRSDTPWFNRLRDFPRCHIRGRLKFGGPESGGKGAPFPSVMVGINVDLSQFAEVFQDLGDIFIRYIPGGSNG